jgi:hypothetical protein
MAAKKKRKRSSRRSSRNTRHGNAQPRFGLPKAGDTIYWIRDQGPGDRRVLVAMYFKGRLTRDTDEGRRGDVRARPKRLGPGDYTAPAPESPRLCRPPSSLLS